jgi:vacuolar-type H+-ATPase subunit D/Vma8
MSGNSNRLVVAPTVTVLQVIKGRLIGATKGHQLLKKKADALTLRYRQILREIVEAKEGMGDKMKGSFFSLAEAKYAAGAAVSRRPRQAPWHPPGAATTDRLACRVLPCLAAMWQ